MSERFAPGVLVLVVGPSGAGKDTLISHARAVLGAEFCFPKRIVTRAASAHEDHGSLSPEAFVAAEADGRFALSWRAHGLSYGLPASICGDVEAGHTVVCNVSRGAVAQARQTCEQVRTIYVDATPAIRAARIAARGREVLLESRVGDERALLTADWDVVIDNSHSLASSTGAFVAALEAFARSRR